MRRFAHIVASIGVVIALAGCDEQRSTTPPAPVGSATRASSFLTIGSSATEGDGVSDRLHEAWPYLMFDHAFPISTTLVNAAIDGATVTNASVQQLPVARRVEPDVVAIWLGVDDLAQHTPIHEFTPALEKLIQEVRATGAQRILVADIPSVFGESSALYNAAIRHAVRATKSTLVELSRAAVTLTPSRGLNDQPDAASQRVIALAFERALKTLG